MPLKKQLSKPLLNWYDAHRRDLPWRGIRDPYAIWLSEVMLQQTTVRAVEPRWTRFLKRWPTAAALANAPLADVLQEWTGLGYYARARNLHRAAGIIRDQFGGAIPPAFELLLALPGMGVYTAAAVASIAFGEAVAVVDANVERVLARLFAIEENIRTTPMRKKLREHVADLLDRKRPGDYNQAIMELGATICLPRKPRCPECPIASWCEARKRGIQETVPVIPAKTPMQKVRESAVIIRDRKGRVLLLLRAMESSFGGMWETPRAVCGEHEEARAAAGRAATEIAGLSVSVGAPALRLRHTVMRNQITLTVFGVTSVKGKVRLSAQHDDHRWATTEEWLTMPKSTTQADIAEFVATGNLPAKSVTAEDTGERDFFSDEGNSPN
ncbi:A/G-specific adenine glycosylase [soil metagenome]